MQRNILQSVYAWTGFVLFWTFTMFVVWSFIQPDNAIVFLVEIITRYA